MTMKEATEFGDIFVTTTGCKSVIRGEHLEKMKGNAILANIGYFDHEIDMHWPESQSDITETNIKPLVDKFEFADGRALILLSRGSSLTSGASGRSSHRADTRSDQISWGPSKRFLETGTLQVLNYI